MQFLTRSECAPVFSKSHLRISERGFLEHTSEIPADLRRVEGGPSDVERLGYFAESLIRWLPADSGRLLFINSWEDATGSSLAAFQAIRAGVGEHRDIMSAPGHYFQGWSWTWDLLEMSREQRYETQLLVGMLVLVMAGRWDGWLASEKSGDLVEFWEGNVLFYSGNNDSLEAARHLFTSLECRQKMI